MAQKGIKDYFSSQKSQNKGKNSTRKRLLESATVSRSKKRKVYTQPSQVQDLFTSKVNNNNKDGGILLGNICASSLSTSPSISTTNCYETPDSIGETSPPGDKSSSTKLNCFEILPSAVSPFGRGAECVRLALEKTSSTVSLCKEKTPMIGETRRKLFSPEVNDEPGIKIKHSTDKEIPSATMKKSVTAEDKPSDIIRPVKQSISGITPLAKKSTDMTVSKEAPMLKPFKSLQYDSPTKGDKTSSIPAYERYKSLVAETTPVTTDLPLPKHYGLLAEKFHCTDTIVNMYQRRSEICTFTKLKLAVQQMNRRSFSTRDLAKMITVYPTALLLAQQTHIPGAYGRDIYNSYQLTIECNVKELADDSCGMSPVVRSSTQPTCLVSSVLLRRRQKFKNNLVSIVKQHHKEFLAKLKPPLSLDDDEIVRWHPGFVLENVADVKEASLPQPPLLQTCSTARDVLNLAQSSIIPSRMQQALENVATSSKSAKSEQQVNDTAPLNPAIEKALKGVSQSLIDKIRQKETHRARVAMTRNHATEKKLTMLLALPEMCRIIQHLFLADKKAAIPVEEVTNTLVDNAGMSQETVEAHLSLMEDVLPQWFKRVTVRKICYIKVDRKMSIKSILEKIEQYKELL